MMENLPNDDSTDKPVHRAKPQISRRSFLLGGAGAIGFGVGFIGAKSLFNYLEYYDRYYIEKQTYKLGISFPGQIQCMHILKTDGALSKFNAVPAYFSGQLAATFIHGFYDRRRPRISIKISDPSNLGRNFGVWTDYELDYLARGYNILLTNSGLTSPNDPVLLPIPLASLEQYFKAINCAQLTSLQEVTEYPGGGSISVYASYPQQVTVYPNAQRSWGRTVETSQSLTPGYICEES